MLLVFGGRLRSNGADFLDKFEQLFHAPCFGKRVRVFLSISRICFGVVRLGVIGGFADLGVER